MGWTVFLASPVPRVSPLSIAHSKFKSALLLNDF